MSKPNDDTTDVGSNKKLPILTRPPHEMPRAVWQDTIPAYRPGPLTQEQVETFYKDGVLVLPEFYSPHQINAAKAEMELVIDELAQKMYNARRISKLYDDNDINPWTERLLQMTREDPNAPIFLTKAGVLPSAFWGIFGDPRMLDIATQLGLDEDHNGIALNPAWNVRAKMPNDDNTVVPWHQDNSYWEPRVWDEKVFTVWVALVPASRANGCMQFIKGGHLTGITAPHTIGQGVTWYTELAEDLLTKDLLQKPSLEESDILTCEVPVGTAIIFPGTTPHRSLNSTASCIRWSTDFRLHNRTAVRPGKTDLDWFYGLKDSFLLRDNLGVKAFTETERDQWAGVDRTEEQDKHAGVQKDTTFDPLIVGLWMDLWDIKQREKEGSTNAHIERYVETLMKDDSTKNLVQSYRDRNNW